MKFIPLFLSITFITIFSTSCNKCESKVDSNCVCIEIYDPVCGCDGKTYGNSCYAECAGVEDYDSGTCK